MRLRLGLVWVLCSVWAHSACFEDEPQDGGTPPDGRAVLDGGAPDSGGGADRPLDDRGLGDGGVEVDAGEDAGGADAGGACRLVADTTRLEFGAVEPGRRDVLPLVLRNLGGADCHIRRVSLTQPGTAFALGALSTTSVAPARSTILDVIYGSPTPGPEEENDLEVELAEAGPLTLPLSATSTAPIVRTVPSAIDMGVVPVNCMGKQRIFSVWLPGAETGWTLSSTATDSAFADDFEMLGTAPPVTLTPDLLHNMTVRIRPMSPGPMAVRYALTFDPYRVVTVPLRAEGRALPAAVEDVFVQQKKPLSLLFIVDPAAALGPLRTAIGTALEPVIDALRTEGVDLDIGVIFTNQGSPNIGLRIAGADPQAGPTLTAALRDAVGSGDRAVLSLMAHAFLHPVLTGANAGFLKPGGALSVVIITDRDDSSRVLTPSFYPEVLRDVAGRHNATLSSFTVLPSEPAACATQGAVAARKISGVAEFSGGIAASICNPAASIEHLHALWRGQRNTMLMSSFPEDSNFTVLVDGVAVPAGPTTWAWDGVSVSAHFVPAAAPPVGAEIRVRYRASCI